jgi:hypothetical protein
MRVPFVITVMGFWFEESNYENGGKISEKDGRVFFSL